MAIPDHGDDMDSSGGESDLNEQDGTEEHKGKPYIILLVSQYYCSSF
jgi:hypothetical protein